jgi:AcrR family transcriptional regulator
MIRPVPPQRRITGSAAARTSDAPDTGVPRSYLRSWDRRRQLLDVATRIAGREGVERLTIVGLAQAAGVSRQLVYDHFSDLSGLVWAVLLDRFAAIDEAIGDTIERAGPLNEDDAVEVVLSAARRFLALSREDRHILRSVLTNTDAPDHELNALALQLRAHSIGRWNEVFSAFADPGASGRTWALVNALNGLGDLVSTDQLNVDEALEEFELLIRASVAAAAARGHGRGAASDV